MISTSFIPEPAGSGKAGVGQVARMLEQFAVFGGLETGGVTRLCASAADGEARDAFAALLEAAGAQVRTDSVGNQYGIFRLAASEDAPLVMMGSHLDSQPQGGRFDGVLGVLGALETGRRLMQAKREGVVFNADFCAVNWTNEEGARFRPSLLGSGTFSGRINAEDALASRDDDGLTLAEALDAIGYLGTDNRRRCRPAMSSCMWSRARSWKRKACPSVSSRATGARPRWMSASTGSRRIRVQRRCNRAATRCLPLRKPSARYAILRTGGRTRFIPPSAGWSCSQIRRMWCPRVPICRSSCARSTTAS